MSLDLSGLVCPDVTLQAKRALEPLPAGETLTILSTDPLSAIDIPLLAARIGCVVLSRTMRDETIVFVLRKAGA